MTATNFAAALAFVWQVGFDSPTDGYHVTPGDPGGATKGGIIAATWDDALAAGLVTGSLLAASNAQLADVLQATCWGPACNALAPGVDLLLFNGRMMSGHFPWLFQECIGFIGPDDVDGYIGPVTLARAATRDTATLIDALAGVHYGYLTTLRNWRQNATGWTKRLVAAQAQAHTLAGSGAVA